ncbi:hypothetical protein ACFUJY_30210 [Streptomyces sp. NPDC057249]|uniref:hypothetical protein n=1 Tax=Streptomyces sp. NPDC057249 TaxID=3346067 RepID=UPI00362F2B50
MTARAHSPAPAPARPLREPHNRPPLGLGAAAALVLAATLLAAAGSPAAAGDLNLVVVDNSEADSWLEIDRTANTNHGSGTSGSDHDGSAVDLMDTLINPDSTDDDAKDRG